MALVSRGKNLIGGHRDAGPPFAALLESFYRLPAGVRFLHVGRYQMGNRLAVARDCNSLAALDRAQ